MRNRILNAIIFRIVFGDVNTAYHRARERVGLGSAAGMFFEAISPFLFLQPTLPVFEYPRTDLPRQIHFVGALLPEAPATFAAPVWWNALDAGRPVVHVTQGTLATNSNDLIVPTIQALADSEVVVVATTGGRAPTSVPIDPLPKNVYIEPFISYAHLLPKVSVMITNCGYGGVHYALTHGIPLIAAGATEEKPEIANRIAWAGVGLNLRTGQPQPAQIRNAVQTILSDPRYRQNAQRIREEFAHFDAVARSVSLLERLAATRQPVFR
jgi:UDP:flavonoid glycosyltransferase YjiC (YdhE family)